MPPAFNPKGKSFQERLDAMMAHAQSTYGVRLRVTSQARTVQQQQTMHVGHMFLYNAFNNRQPKQYEKNANNRLVIAWGHFSRADLAWGSGVRWENFLRDAAGRTCAKDDTGKGWKAGQEPNREKTQEHVRWLLKDHFGIGNRGTAMAAPGVGGCAEPCVCGGGRSKHVAGVAVDLGNLDALQTTLANRGAGSLDAYLGKFGLYRPMKDLPEGVRELWHVEAT